MQVGEHDAVADLFAFQPLDRSCRWTVEFWLLKSTEQRVAVFEPRRVIVRAFAPAHVAAPFWPPSACRKPRKQPAAKDEVHEDNGDDESDESDEGVVSESSGEDVAFGSDSECASDGDDDEEKSDSDGSDDADEVRLVA